MRSVMVCLLSLNLAFILSGCGDEYPDCNINTTSIVTEGRVSYDASTCDPNGLQEPLTDEQLENLLLGGIGDNGGPGDGPGDADCFRNPQLCEGN